MYIDNNSFLNYFFLEITTVIKSYKYHRLSDQLIICVLSSLNNLIKYIDNLLMYISTFIYFEKCQKN